MKKILAALTAVALLAAATVATSTDANAQFRRWGPAVGLGILGGVVIGSIIAQRYGPQYVVDPAYTVYPAYAMGPPVGCPGGYWARKPVAFDAYGRPVAWSQPRFFCPEGY